VIEWSHGTFEATRDALPDSDEAVVQFAHQHWRDESGAVLCELQQGVSVDRPSCPVLLIAGEDDEDVPATVSASLAQAWDADLWLLPDQKHLCPLLGRGAPALAQQVVEWSGGLGIRVGPLKGQMLQATCSPGNVK
jgi:pimeloyl-ACP methyl ester carboxylesterase